ncbi:DgyrCDS14613 [Dimorphilus gyrociliatus]|uniref:DgyrCDS14613 n=1 Tax=Dimorphilus gyrociliatus TaxID=2664684 RepID=A0A7I8WE95_9ANNE|nr:DgyrCDS14613 [Dimorphilus gyrociliatus]
MKIFVFSLLVLFVAYQAHVNAAFGDLNEKEKGLAEDENLFQDVEERAIDEHIEEALMKRGRLIGNYYFKCGACVLNPRGKGCQRIIRLCILKFGIKIAKS